MSKFCNLLQTSMCVRVPWTPECPPNKHVIVSFEEEGGSWVWEWAAEGTLQLLALSHPLMELLCYGFIDGCERALVGRVAKKAFLWLDVYFVCN